MRYTRDEVLERLRAEIAAGRPIIGAGAGTGISAKFAEAGGADLIIIYNSGRFRMAGHGSLAGLLAFGDANPIVKEMGEREVLPVVRDDAGDRRRDGHRPDAADGDLLRELDALGFSGINNFPTVGLIDGRFRMELERTGMGFGKRGRHDPPRPTSWASSPAVYVFNPGRGRGDGRGRRRRGDRPHGADGRRVDRARAATTRCRWRRRRRRSRPSARRPGGSTPTSILLCHGGPIATPEDAAYVLDRCDAAGFVGASSMERLPVETAITATIREFKAIAVPARPRTCSDRSREGGQWIECR